jgi:chemotaxis family two-component system response regulator Rcp1
VHSVPNSVIAVFLDVPPMRPLEVLLIEDNPADVKLIREGLKRSCPELGLNVRIAEDGEQALEMMIEEGYRPDMIFLDLGLPKVDGHTVLHRIRSHGINLRDIPVVVFSSLQHGIEEVLDAGANAYIVKPTGLMEYLRAIERFSILWLKSRAGAAAN